jgi:ADP-ribosyl-[dinitrogen reductase] hydrolase
LHWYLCGAQKDASLTHPHPVCLQANALFAMAIADAIGTGKGAPEIYDQFKKWAVEMRIEAPLRKVIVDASTSPPANYLQQQGWVLIAFQNALWQLLHAASLEEGVVHTVMRGGDTDTNATIAGALLGAVYGLDAIPAQWRDKLLNCRPEAGRRHVRHPRPECFWGRNGLSRTEG